VTCGAGSSSGVAQRLSQHNGDDGRPEVESLPLKLPCQHQFHRGCILAWLQRRATCPVCRELVDVEAFQNQQESIQQLKLGCSSCDMASSRPNLVVSPPSLTPVAYSKPPLDVLGCGWSASSSGKPLAPLALKSAADPTSAAIATTFYNVPTRSPPQYATHKPTPLPPPPPLATASPRKPTKLTTCERSATTIHALTRPHCAPYVQPASCSAPYVSPPPRADKIELATQHIAGCRCPGCLSYPR